MCCRLDGLCPGCPMLMHAKKLPCIIACCAVLCLCAGSCALLLTQPLLLTHFLPNVQSCSMSARPSMIGRYTAVMLQYVSAADQAVFG
jgi:hypothetical protein